MLNCLEKCRIRFLSLFERVCISCLTASRFWRLAVLSNASKSNFFILRDPFHLNNLKPRPDDVLRRDRNVHAYKVSTQFMRLHQSFAAAGKAIHHCATRIRRGEDDPLKHVSILLSRIDWRLRILIFPNILRQFSLRLISISNQAWIAG